MSSDIYTAVAPIVIFLTMAFALPWLLQPTLWGILRYSLYSIIVWISYVYISSISGSLGVGFLVPGIFSWISGMIFLTTQLQSRKKLTASPDKAEQGA